MRHLIVAVATMAVTLMLSVTTSVAAESHTQAAFASRDAGSHSEPLRRGAGYSRADGSRRVRVLQRVLRRLGAGPGPIDGLYGPRTERAVRAVQERLGLAVDGVAGPDTLAVLAERRPAAALHVGT